MKSELNKELITIIENNDTVQLEEKLRDVSDARSSDYYLDINQRKNQREEPVDNFKDDLITLLHAAAYYNSLECFVFLNEEKHICLNAVSVRSYYPLHYACYNGSREVVAYILSKEPNQAAELPKDVQHHFLYFAVYGGDPIILRELFRNGADLSREQNKKDDPIGKAIDISNIECLKVLLDYEAPTQNNSTRTPAMLAALNCHPKALRILIKSSDDLSYFSQNNESVLSLMFSYSNGNLFKDIIIELLTKYPDTKIDPPEGITMPGVCHWVCKMCDVKVAELMVHTPDIAINRLDQNGHTGPYFLSMQKDFKDGDAQASIKILKILIGHGLDVNYRKDLNTPTILEIFVKAMKVRYRIIEYLLNNKADPHVPYSKNKSITLYQEIMSNRIRDQQLKDLFAPFALQE